MTNGFAVIVTIGPGKAELRRFHDSMDSLWTYEPGARLVVAIDDSANARELANGLVCGDSRLVTLKAPFGEQGEPLLGRLSAGVLLALRTIHQAGSFEFVVRLDSDALIIGPFRDAVRSFIALNPEAGMVGTLGCTCCREAPYYGCERTAISDVFVELDTKPASPEFARIREHARLAVENGYAGKEYCQGGAYVLQFETLDRMSAAGCLDSPQDWLTMAVPEDVMMGMYVRTVGLRSLDFSLPGQPFGNHFRGLAYSPRELARRGHSLIHSTKGDLEYSEWHIRRYFRARRRKGVSAASAAK